VQAGKLKMLAVVDDERFPLLPQVPTHKEAIRGYDPKQSWTGFMGPPGMPAEIASRLSKEIQAAVRRPDIAKVLVDNGLTPIGTTGEQFAAQIKEEIDSWTRIVKASNIRVTD